MPVLSAHIEALEQGKPAPGLTEKEIEAGFNELASKFLRSEYHPTYVQRRLGPHGFLEVNGGRYSIRRDLLGGVALREMIDLRTELVDSLRSAYERRQAVIRKLEETCALPQNQIQERHSVVDDYLHQVGGSQGEMFEVISFAVLREYFRTFGFTLQRFSTTHANDGGMDFVGADAIYQVSTEKSLRKVQKDLGKAPGTKRVLVRPSFTEDVMRACQDEVLETIDLKDLLNHFISWLLARDTRSKKARHLQEVIRVALEEFRRENKAERAYRTATR